MPRLENFPANPAILTSTAELKDGIYIVRDSHIAHRFNHETVRSKPIVVDCFLFRDELDILELRFEELYESVDYFVLVESTKTWSGMEKPLVFDMNRHRFEKWLTKIIYVQDSEIPNLAQLDTTAARQVLESHQRNLIAEGLSRLELSEVDIVMISDVDEIPRPQYVQLLNNLLPPDKFITFVMKLFICYVNNISQDRLNGKPWGGTVAGRYGHFAKFTPTFVRFKGDPIDEHRAGLVLYHYRFEDELYIDDGGWHFSYFGGPEQETFKLSTLVEMAGAHEKLPFNGTLPSRHNYRYYRESVPEWRDVLSRSSVHLRPVTQNFEIEDIDLPKALLTDPRKYERFFFLADTLD